MRHEVVAAQLIRNLRGKRSQTAFSRHLGYRGNVLYSWESGRRWPTARTFFQVALRSRVDVRGGIRQFLGRMPPWLEQDDVSQADVIAQLLDELRGGMSIAELARRVGSNRVSVSRWLHAQAEPRLPELLALIDAASARLLDFIAIFAEPHELPECRLAWQELEAQRQVAYGLPWSHAVLRALELEEYKALGSHREGWIAERLCISLELERTCIEALAASKLIVKRRKRWAVHNVLTVDTRRNPLAGTRIKEHWAEVAKQRLAQLEPNTRDLFSYNLFTVSEADWLRLRELHIDYYQQLQSLVSVSQPAERVVLANVQLLRLDEPLPEVSGGEPQR